MTVSPVRVRRHDEQVGVASSSTPARGGEEEANNNIGDSGRQPRPRQEGRRGQPKSSYWEESLGMTKDLRHVQMREAKLLAEAAELKKEKARTELEQVKQQRTRDEEKFRSEMRKKKFEEGRAQMLYQLCNKEYLSKFGKEYNMNEVMNSLHFLLSLVFCSVADLFNFETNPGIVSWKNGSGSSSYYLTFYI